MTASKVDLVSLASCTVKDVYGQDVKLARLWQTKPAIFVFLRHFACIACRAHAAQIWDRREQYQRHGAQLYFIGNGQPHFIQKFKEDMNLGDALVFTDPSLESFRAAGFKRGFLATVGPRSIANAAVLFAQGHRQMKHTEEHGDLWQLGGVLAVTPQGRVTYHFISEATGDFPPEKDVEEITASSDAGD